MKRVLTGAVYAIAGLALAVGLTLGAYVVAGRDLSKPAQPVRVTVPLAPPEASPSARSTATPDDSPSPDDRGTDDRSGSGRGRSGSGDDSGSSSGSGSSHSGSGDD